MILLVGCSGTDMKNLESDGYDGFVMDEELIIYFHECCALSFGITLVFVTAKR